MDESLYPPGDDVLWQGTCRARFVVPTVAGLLGLGGVMAAVANPVVGGLVALTSLAVVPFRSVTVSVTPDAVLCRLAGPGPRPGVTIPRTEIARAEAVDVRPMSYGGWGYRGSLRLFRWAAMTLRAGPGLRLDLTDGRVFVVTVDGPAGALPYLPTRHAAAPARA